MLATPAAVSSLFDVHDTERPTIDAWSFAGCRAARYARTFECGWRFAPQVVLFEVAPVDDRPLVVTNVVVFDEAQPPTH